MEGQDFGYNCCAACNNCAMVLDMTQNTISATGRCPHGRSVASRTDIPCPPGLAGCSLDGDDGLMGRALDIGDCTCVFSCGDDPATGCSLSGREFHVHPNRYRGDVFGPCPLHPDAPGDL